MLAAVSYLSLDEEPNMECILAVAAMFALGLLVYGAARSALGQQATDRGDRPGDEKSRTVYMHREGKLQPADEGFNAWMSGDLGRMERALKGKANNVDRHFIYLQICKDAYKGRSDPNARAKFLRYAREHIAGFPKLLPALKREFDASLPRVPTFQQLATVLAEDGDFDEAIEVCKLAMGYGLVDGTKSGFEGRIARLERKRERKADRC